MHKSSETLFSFVQVLKTRGSNDKTRNSFCPNSVGHGAHQVRERHRKDCPTHSLSPFSENFHLFHSNKPISIVSGVMFVLHDSAFQPGLTGPRLSIPDSKCDTHMLPLECFTQDTSIENLNTQSSLIADNQAHVPAIPTA